MMTLELSPSLHWANSDTIANDNGPAFTSGKFEQFVKLNRIRQVKTAPYHPAMNVLAGQSVQIFKRSSKMDSWRPKQHVFCLARLTPQITAF